MLLMSKLTVFSAVKTVKKTNIRGLLEINCFSFCKSESAPEVKVSPPIKKCTNVNIYIFFF